MKTKKCVFCDRKNFEERLIFENSLCYVMASLGQITDGGYILIVPKMHASCFGALPKDINSRIILRMLLSCRKISKEYLKRDSCQMLILEHGVIGQTIPHAHMHILPVNIDLTDKIKKDFPESKIQELHQWESLSRMYSRKKQPYLLWMTPVGKLMICWNPPAPPQYLRTITAELLRRPERADWKKMDPELDTRLWKNTVLKMKGKI